MTTMQTSKPTAPLPTAEELRDRVRAALHAVGVPTGDDGALGADRRTRRARQHPDHR